MKNHSPSIYIIDDDQEMAECIKRAIRKVWNYDVQIFTDAIAAMNSLDEKFPALIFLDILLNGPNGFTFLNELVSYTDTAKIPIVIVSSLNLAEINLSSYNIIKVLQKETMTPREIQEVIRNVL